MRYALAILVALVPLLLGGIVFRKISRSGRVSRRLSLISALLGAIGAIAASYLERVVLSFAELDFDAHVAGASGALMATFLLAAPLEEALKVLAIWGLYRTRRIDRGRVGVCYAVVAAAGFAAAEAVIRIVTAAGGGLSVVRALFSALAHLFFAGVWGYALGARSRRGRWFPLTWLGTVLLHGLYSHIVWGRGPGYLVLAVPLLGFMLLATWLGLRDITPEGAHAHGLLEPPSLSEMREALRPHDRPVMLRWVLAGSFVTLGLIVALVALSIVLGRRLGVDFALADEADFRSSAPLILLGVAVLAAFPIAGYLVARASSAPTVLEPALATLLALGGLVALLAATAPVAVLFALAVAPVALGLACGGAWIGLEH